MVGHVRVLGVVALTALLLVMGGCKKKQTTLDVPKDTAPKADTGFSEPAPFAGVDTSNDASFREAELDAELLRQVKENLRAVYFDFNSYNLTENSIENLRTAANFLMSHKKIRILVEGHCDERGSSEYNMGLGENRARAVKQYLTNYGLPSVQFETTSWGKEKPVRVGCSDDDCHQENRRAEFKVLSK